MQLDEAREIAADHGVEEGAKFNFNRMGSGETVGEVTITDVDRSGAGIRNVAFTIEANGNVKEDKNSIRKVAGFLDNDYWTEVEN